jgi:hypothetical protein
VDVAASSVSSRLSRRCFCATCQVMCRQKAVCGVKPALTLPELDRSLGAGGLPQARTQRDKGITIGALGSRWLYTKNARFAYGDATHCGERYRFLVQTSSQNS